MNKTKLTRAEKVEIAQRTASYLVGAAAHANATASFDGLGEITLRDGLVAVLAASAAARKQAWIIKREFRETWWGSPIDVVMTRKGKQRAKPNVGGIELKIWRQTDNANASKRRTDLLIDIYKAAAFHSLKADFAFVALLSSYDSWQKTWPTSTNTVSLFAPLFASGAHNWSTTVCATYPAARAALDALFLNVPIASGFQTELLAVSSHLLNSQVTHVAGVWAVRKNNNTTFY